MCLSGEHVDLCKGHVVALYRGQEARAHVRVMSLEEANRLEALAVSPRVYGRWRPHYRYEDKALSVSEFEEALTKNPKAFAEPRKPTARVG
jgi:hypothetical protein